MNLQVSQRRLPGGDLLKKGCLGRCRGGHVQMEEVQDSLCEEPEERGRYVIVVGEQWFLAATEGLGDDYNEQADCYQLQPCPKKRNPKHQAKLMERLAQDSQ